ncbi:SRPBCC family protein [Actinoplanes solisilvae]|uniref:SRPBCC family protein n=1 Tax=Actinoplanes solisilvae TaxID=2486853 RepID=UPI0013E3BFCC|nr:SRPBCC family protein [Actinoplanes solisilvae]
MIVRTRWTVPQSPDDMWPALCDSSMELKPRCPVFYLGTPQPTECRLPDGEGAVGASRQCVSEQGVVRQRIDVWEPPARLSFHMEETDLCFRGIVESLGDTFELEPSGTGTRITRTTTVSVRNRFAAVFYPALWFGLKSVHRFVFCNWQRRPVGACGSWADGGVALFALG